MTPVSTMSDRSFSLRDAAPADVPDVLRLLRGLAEYERLLHEFTATEAGLHAALFGPVPRIRAMLAEHAGSAVGLALWFYTFSTFHARTDLFLEDLYVEPAHRGSGIGLALLRQLARRALAENCRRIEWRVLNWNTPAIEFYRRIGATAMQDWHVRQLGGDALAALANGDKHG